MTHVAGRSPVLYAHRHIEVLSVASWSKFPLPYNMLTHVAPETMSMTEHGIVRAILRRMPKSMKFRNAMMFPDFIARDSGGSSAPIIATPNSATGSCCSRMAYHRYAGPSASAMRAKMASSALFICIAATPRVPRDRAFPMVTMFFENITGFPRGTFRTSFRVPGSVASHCAAKATMTAAASIGMARSGGVPRSQITAPIHTMLNAAGATLATKYLPSHCSREIFRP